MLGVARLVEERAPVVRPAHRLDHEHHLAGHLDRGAESTRRLGRARLDVEVDVRLRVEVDSEVGERAAQGRQHPVGGEGRVPARAAEEACEVVALGLGEADSDLLAECSIHRGLVEALRRIEEGSALSGEPFQLQCEPVAVEEEVVVRPESWNRALRRLDRIEVERVQVLLGQRVARLLEPRPRRAIRLVRDRRPQHPVADRLAVVRDLERGFESRNPLSVLARQLAEIALAAEAEELEILAPLDGRADPLDRLEVGEIGMPLVDRSQLEVGLVAGVVEVVLLVELCEEAVGSLAVAVELALAGDWLAHAA